MKLDAPERHVAWQGAMASALLNVVGTPLDIAMGASIRGMPKWPGLVSMSVGVVLVLWLLAHRSTASVRASSTVFLLNNLAVVSALWVTSGYFAAGPRPWVPFQANKLGVLVVAMITPAEPAVGVASILLFSAGALLKYGTFDAALRARLPPGEPWSMVAFTVFAVGLLIYRLRRKALERQLIRAQAEAEALESTTRRLLAIQDLANTPLQTLEANTALLSDVPGADPYVERMQRALVRLQEWHRILREDPENARWSGQHESFDARQVLADSHRRTRAPFPEMNQPERAVRKGAAVSAGRGRAHRR